MAHNIEIGKDGRAKMAYSNREIPWHRLGKPMDKDALTAEEMLVAAQADFDVVLASVAAIDAEGNMLRNPDGTPSSSPTRPSPPTRHSSFRSTLRLGFCSRAGSRTAAASTA